MHENLFRLVSVIQKDSLRFTASALPVSVIMQREERQHGDWSYPSWQALGVVAGEQVTKPGLKRTLVRCDDSNQEYLWSGFTLELFKDGAESYYYNLIGTNPSLFVICREEDDGSLVPSLVTANPDEAGAHMEADDTVFSVAMPAEIYKWLEAFVVENYVPQRKKKRKRTDWHTGPGNDNRR